MPGVCRAQPVLQLRLRGPARLLEAADIQELGLTRRAVRLRFVEAKRALKLHQMTDKSSEIDDGNIFADAEIDVLFAGVVLQQKDRHLGQIFYMEEFA